jgi:hypothetical protein
MSTMKRAPSRASPPPTLEPWAPRFGDGLHDPLRRLTAMAIDDCEREDKNLEHRVEIELTHYTSSGARFRVTYLGKTLIESARDPEHEACRALLAQGIKGKLVTYSPGSLVARMRIDIETGAKLTIIENVEEGPRRARYRRHPGSTEPDDAE